MTHQPIPPAISKVIDACVPDVQTGLYHLRQLILTCAARLPAIGPVTEALRWGQPAFLTLETGAAASLRIGPVPDGFALFVHCQTNLIAAFLSGPGAGFRTQGSRAVLFHGPDDIIDAPLTLLVGSTLTYRQRKK